MLKTLRDAVLIPGSEEIPGEGHGNPLQHSCLENPMDRGVWWATVHGVTELDMTEATQHAGRLKSKQKRTMKLKAVSLKR